MSQVISLSKGEVINLSKHSAIDLSKGGSGLKKVVVGLGWDPISKTAAQTKYGKKSGLFGLFGGSSLPEGLQRDIDCDAFAVELDSNGKYQSRCELVYYGSLTNGTGTIRHTGDNLTGDGDGDDEQIIIDLEHIPSYVNKIGLSVDIYQGPARKQHFGLLSNAFIRIVDSTTNKELCRFDLNDDYEGKTAMLFGELEKVGSDWQFKALGEGLSISGISEIVSKVYK